MPIFDSEAFPSLGSKLTLKSDNAIRSPDNVKTNVNVVPAIEQKSESKKLDHKDEKSSSVEVGKLDGKSAVIKSSWSSKIQADKHLEKSTPLVGREVKSAVKEPGMNREKIINSKLKESLSPLVIKEPVSASTPIISTIKVKDNSPGPVVLPAASFAPRRKNK